MKKLAIVILLMVFVSGCGVVIYNTKFIDDLYEFYKVDDEKSGPIAIFIYAEGNKTHAEREYVRAKLKYLKATIKNDKKNAAKYAEILKNSYKEMVKVFGENKAIDLTYEITAVLIEDMARKSNPDTVIKMKDLKYFSYIGSKDFK